MRLGLYLIMTLYLFPMLYEVSNVGYTSYCSTNWWVSCMCVFAVIWILRRFSRSPEPGICWPHIHASQGIRHWETNDRVGSLELQAGCTPFLQAQAGISPQSVFSPGKEWAGPFFPRGKSRPALSFPTQSVPPPNNFKNHNGIIISLHKFKNLLLN